jgi:hypothetical protein
VVPNAGERGLDDGRLHNGGGCWDGLRHDGLVGICWIVMLIVWCRSERCMSIGRKNVPPVTTPSKAVPAGTFVTHVMWGWLSHLSSTSIHFRSYLQHAYEYCD